MHRRLAVTLVVISFPALVSSPLLSSTLFGKDLIPPPAGIKTDRPRVLLRPNESRHAISLAQLKAIPRDAEFNRMLSQLRSNDHAAAQAMVWLLTGEKNAAEKAIARMRRYEFPGKVDTFHVYFRLMEFALAYDWLYDYEGFTGEIKAEVRRNVTPLARHGYRVTDDHVFHNYIWMSAGGTALWTLATAGEDRQADELAAQVFQRLNRRLLPAMEYLDGLPCEPMGYWALYDFTPALLAVLAAQSAFESDLVGAVKSEHGDWLNRHFDNLVHSTLPDMRYLPWGDLQSGPNGGVTHEMAGAIDAATRALSSPHGAYFSRWLAGQRGTARFHAETAVFYMLYTRQLQTRPATPPLSFLGGNQRGGHFIARSGWDDGDTVVALRCTDHFGDHNHYDQGSFIIYRNGLLAVDPPVYRRIRGPQQKTENHNTLLLDSKPQRPVRGQWFTTVDQFRENLTAGERLETGDILFRKEAENWTAVAGQFARAYSPEIVQSCVRQLLFVRPGTVVVVDQLTAPQRKDLPEVQWLLHVPARPTLDGGDTWSSNGKSWIRCRPLLPGVATAAPTVTATDVGTHRISYRYPGGETLTLMHVLEVGDGERPAEAAEVRTARTSHGIELTLGGRTFTFATVAPFAVSVKEL